MNHDNDNSDGSQADKLHGLQIRLATYPYQPKMPEHHPGVHAQRKDVERQTDEIYEHPPRQLPIAGQSEQPKNISNNGGSQ